MHTGYAALLFASGLAGSLAFAQAPAQEQAVTRTARDADLKWGPCPPFLPKGCGIAVLHGDPAKNNVDVFLKVPGKSVLKPGTYAYGPAKRPHKASCNSSDACVLFIAFESPLDAVPVENKAK